MGTIKTTCGCFLIDPLDRLLICEVTGHPGIWSIPKGIPDPNEKSFTAAKRELLEETNIDIDKYPYTVYDMGIVDYTNKRKALQGYLFRLKDFITEKPECKSFFHHFRYDVMLPEVNCIEWVSINEALIMIQEEQQQILFRYAWQQTRR